MKGEKKKEEYFESKTKNCLPRKTDTDVERIFQESAKVTDKRITKIINNQQDIKLGDFTDEVLTKIINRKAWWSDVWKINKFDDLLLRYCNIVYNQNTIER